MVWARIASASPLSATYRALLAWTALAWALMLICYFFLPPPPAPADNPNLPVNINYVYGLSDTQAQTWMPPGVYLVLWMVALPVVFFLPTYWALARLFRPAPERRI